jgi:hypothetical protein
VQADEPVKLRLDLILDPRIAVAGINLWP